MPYLVYQYDVKSEEERYLMISPDDLDPCSAEKLLAAQPKRANQNLIKAGYDIRKLSEEDQQSLRCHSAATEDSQKTKDFRLAPKVPFQEFHEQLDLYGQPPVKVSARVEVWWPRDEKYYPGTVVECVGDICKVEYDDDETEWLRLTDQDYKVISAAEGMTLEVQQEGESTWRVARVYEKRGDRVNLQFEDGETEWVVLSEIKYRSPNGNESDEEDDDDEQSDGEKSPPSTPNSVGSGFGSRLAMREKKTPISADTNESSFSPLSSAEASGAKDSGFLPKRTKNPSTDDREEFGKHTWEYLQSRGYKRPKSRPSQRADGMYSQPAGRPPLGMEWSAKYGLWKPLKNKKRGCEEDSPRSATPGKKKKKQRVENGDSTASPAKTAADFSASANLLADLGPKYDTKANETVLGTVHSSNFSKFGEIVFDRSDGKPYFVCSPAKVDDSVAKQKWREMAVGQTVPCILQPVSAIVGCAGGKVASAMPTFLVREPRTLMSWEEGQALGFDKAPEVAALRSSGVLMKDEDTVMGEAGTAKASAVASQGNTEGTPVKRSSSPTKETDSPGKHAIVSESSRCLYRVKEELDKLKGCVDASRVKSYLRILQELEQVNVTYDLLQETEVSKSVVELKKLEIEGKDAAKVKKLAKALCKKWKKIYTLESFVNSLRSAVEKSSAMDTMERLADLRDSIKKDGDGVFDRSFVKRSDLEEIMTKISGFFEDEKLAAELGEQVDLYMDVYEMISKAVN